MRGTQCRGAAYGGGVLYILRPGTVRARQRGGSGNHTALRLPYHYIQIDIGSTTGYVTRDLNQISTSTRGSNSVILNVPVDIWLEILSHTARPDLCSLTLVTPTLRWLAQSLMFESLVLRIPGQNSNQTRFLLKLALFISIRRGLHSKFAFFTSPRIAPLVRNCKLLGDSSGAPEVYGVALCDALPKFPRLRRLHLEDILMTPRMVRKIAKVSSDIQLCLRLIRCTPRFPVSLWVSPILLEELSLTTNDEDPEAVIYHNRWLSILSLNLQKLRVLVLRNVESTMKSMEIFIDSPDFPGLEVLSLDSGGIDKNSEQKFISILSRFPSLRTLELHSSNTRVLWSPWSSEIPATTVPLLSCFCGPAHLAPAFCAGRQITRLKLQGTVGVQPCEQQLLDLHLFGMIASKNVTLASLQLRVKFPTQQLLEAIATSFPMLRSLRFFSRPLTITETPRPNLQAILNTIDNIVLPPHLEVLYVAFLQVGPKLDRAMKQEKRQIVTTIRGLVQRYPSLRHFSLSTDLSVNGKIIGSMTTAWKSSEENIFIHHDWTTGGWFSKGCGRQCWQKNSDVENGIRVFQNSEFELNFCPNFNPNSTQLENSSHPEELQVSSGVLKNYLILSRFK
ncbi:hypothetical protein K438DRAFT_1929894 [Mycena galopus ATCC 62051]|nr:hypothetical protein K438DRAFT_1929894 [Mycena galopus ATCC 62051]